MKYQEAFISVVNKYGYEILNDRFLSHSLLSDAVGGSLYDNQLLDCFYLLNKNLYSQIVYHSLTESKNIVKNLIVHADKKYMVSQYIRSIEPLLLLMYPNEYVPYQEKKVGVIKGKKAQPKNKAPVHQKTKAKKINIKTVSIIAKCPGLKIAYCEKGNYQLLDNNGVDITNQVICDINNNVAELKIPEACGFATLLLKKKEYNSLNIVTKDIDLSIRDTVRFRFKEINADVSGGYSALFVDTEKIVWKQNSGSVFVGGAVKNIVVDGSSVSFAGMIWGSNLGYYRVHTKYGEIEMKFYAGKVKPKVNHLFSKVHTVRGEYRVSNKKINLDLYAPYRKIKVR